MVFNSDGDLQKTLRPQVKTRTWYWVEMSQVEMKGKETVFLVTVSEGASWREVSGTSLTITRPEQHDAVDVWAGYGTSKKMSAIYKNLFWSNKPDLLLIKPQLSLGTISDWGFVFSFKFKMYVSELPRSPAQVSARREHQA